MPTAPSFNDLLSVGQAEAQSLRPDLLFAEGDVTVAQLHAAAAMADAVIRYAAQAFKETFIDGATGDALTTLVNDHLNIQRHPATSAQVTLRFTRTSGGAAGSIPLGTEVATDYDANGDRVVFTTDVAVTVPISNNGPFDVAATATTQGTGTNVPAASLTNINSTLFDSTFSVTNLAASGGGNAEEKDEDLRVRARNFFLTLRGGTLAALEQAALSVPEIRVAIATEDSNGITTVRVSDEDGNSTLEMIADAVVAINLVRAAGSVYTVTGGTASLVALGIGLVVRDGFSVAQVSSQLVAAAEARINRIRVGGTLYLDGVTAAIIGLYPDDIFDVDYQTMTIGGVPVVPPADYTPDASIVLRPGAITFVEI